MKIFPYFFLLLLCGSASKAGDYYPEAKMPLPPKEPIEECVDLGGEVEFGYRTDYLIHGLRVDRDTIWLDANYTFDQLSIPLTLGVTHSSGINTVFPYGLIGPIDTTDVYLTTTVEDVAGFDVTLAYTHRFLAFSFPLVNDVSYGELSVDLRRDLGFADFVVGSTLGINSRSSFFAAGGGDGWVHRAGLERSFELCEYADLVVSGGVGYHDGFFYNVAGSHSWSHYYIEAAMPISLNCRTTIKPYIGYNGVQQWDVFFPQGDCLHGGVSVSVEF